MPAGYALRVAGLYVLKRFSILANFLPATFFAILTLRLVLRILRLTLRILRTALALALAVGIDIERAFQF